MTKKPFVGENGCHEDAASTAIRQTTFEIVAALFAETCNIPREEITPDRHIIDDLGVDSLDFLHVAFTVDRMYRIKLPLEQWTQEVNGGKTPSDEYFVMSAFCRHVDALVAAK